MKTRSFLFSVFFATTAFAFFINCSGEKKEADSHEGHETTETKPVEEAADVPESAPQFQVDSKFQEQLSTVFSAYVELKDALVSSDADKVKSEATEAKDALSKVDMKLLKGAAHNDWMAYLSPIQSSLAEIESSTDLEVQRTSFSKLSDNLYKSIKAFGLGGKEAFYEYCPMAFNNEGAYWLSDQAQIRNPYFGDKMLTCGEVKEKLK